MLKPKEELLENAHEISAMRLYGLLFIYDEESSKTKVYMEAPNDDEMAKLLGMENELKYIATIEESKFDKEFYIEWYSNEIPNIIRNKMLEMVDSIFDK